MAGRGPALEREAVGAELRAADGQEHDRCEFIDAAASAFTWDMLQAAQKEQVEGWDV